MKEKKQIKRELIDFHKKFNGRLTKRKIGEGGDELETKDLHVLIESQEGLEAKLC